MPDTDERPDGLPPSRSAAVASQDHEGRQSVLAAFGVRAGYSAEVDILRGVDVELRAREIVSIIGPNGAGKSTLVKAVFGMVPVREGAVRLYGHDIVNRRPHTLVARGMAYVPQRENVFPTLSVRENLEMGATQHRDTMELQLERMLALFPRLRERRNQSAGTLSGGERQMVAIARALMPKPSVLLLDEPSAGLAPQVVSEVFQTVRTIRDEHDVAVLLVEQNARKALAISDRGYVLDQGANARTGTGAALLDDPEVARLYLGGAAVPAPEQRDEQRS